ncbi:hypothetical protein BASA83_012043 [Batrachochytrium salamandrivorans]|nr:hypothetical protein BASA83_012043 [Batrachochytrium salamandrivorans]
MRVGIGIILSVLSSSVLAAVIPDYDSHGILLARRAVNPDPMDLLWKRADEDQEEPGPSSSEAGAGASNYESSPSRTSNNRGRSALELLQSLVKRLHMQLIKTLNTPAERYHQWRDRKLIKATIKKLTEVVEDKNGNKFTSDVSDFLNSTLEGGRTFVGLFDNKARIPFLLVIPEGDNKKSLTKEMLRIQKTAKEHAKKNLKDVLRATNGIKKSPQNVITELGEIMSSASAMHRLITDLRDREYKALISNVGHTKNEVHIKETEIRMSEMNRYQNRISDALNSIKGQINDDMVTFKERVKGKTKSRFGAFKSGFKKRLGFKKKPPTDETPNQEPSNPEPSDQGPPNQDTSDQDTSDQESSDEEVPDQARARPTPAPRLSKLNRQTPNV